MKKTISIVGCLTLILLIWFIVIRPVAANHYLQELNEINLESRFAEYEIKDIHQRIIPLARCSSGEIPYRYRYVNLLLKLASFSKDKERVGSNSFEPDKPEANEFASTRGNIFYEERQERIYQEAERELKIIEQKNPRDFDYYPTLAKLMVQWRKTNSNKNEEVNQVFQQATSINPNNGFLIYLWGEALKEMGEYSQAKEKLTNALILFSYFDLSNPTPEILKNLEFIQAEISYQLSEIEKLIGN